MGKDICKGPVFCLMGKKILKVKKNKQPREKRTKDVNWGDSAGHVWKERSKCLG